MNIMHIGPVSRSGRVVIVFRTDEVKGNNTRPDFEHVILPIQHPKLGTDLTVCRNCSSDFPVSWEEPRTDWLSSAPRSRLIQLTPQRDLPHKKFPVTGGWWVPLAFVVCPSVGGSLVKGRNCT